MGGGDPAAGGRPPSGGQLPPGATRPDGATSPDDAIAPDAGGTREFKPPGKSNILVERFHANPEYEKLYQQRLVELRTTLYESGEAADILGRWVALLEAQASDLVPAATIQSEAAGIASQFESGAIAR
jgi:spore coat protein CotH